MNTQFKSEFEPSPVVVNFYLQHDNASQSCRLMPVAVNMTTLQDPNKTTSQESKLMPVDVDRQVQLGKTSSLQSAPEANQSKITRLRYPGDIADLSNLSRKQLESCVHLCKRKVERQAADIKSLRRQVRDKDRQIEALRSLVKGKK